LCHHGILASAKKGFDFQVLLDPLEEQLHLPACLVDIGNGLGGQFEIVGQKNVVLAGLRIAVANTTQLNGAFFCGLNTSKFDAQITAQAFVFQDRTTTYHTGFCIGPEARDKEYSFLSQAVIPGVVVVTPINNHHAAFGEIPDAPNFDITDLACGDEGEFGQVVCMIQTHMEFDGTFG